MAKSDLPSSDAVLLGKMQRYNFLYNKTDKTSAETTELASLQTELAPYLIRANDWNTLQQQVTDGFNGVTSTVNTAITNHKAETDPHPQYATDSDLTAKAPLASPGLTGTPTAPTAAQTTNNTQIATTAFVKTATGTKNVSSTSLNSLSDTGWYDGSNLTNAPSEIGTGWAYIEVIKHTSWSSTNQYVVQKLYNFNDNRSWQRRSIGGSGTWTPWLPLFTPYAIPGTSTLVLDGGANEIHGGKSMKLPYPGRYRIVADIAADTPAGTTSTISLGDGASQVASIQTSSTYPTYVNATWDFTYAVGENSGISWNSGAGTGYAYVKNIKIYCDFEYNTPQRSTVMFP